MTDLHKDSQRLWDIVRYFRMEAHAAELISDEEYVKLAEDHAAVARLEKGDADRCLQQRGRRFYAELLKENPRSVSKWAEQTFGAAGSNASVAARANEEMSELLMALAIDDKSPQTGEEIADVICVLWRLAVRAGVDVQKAIDAKMKINRARKWNLDGSGHGYHRAEVRS